MVGFTKKDKRFEHAILAMWAGMTVAELDEWERSVQIRVLNKKLQKGIYGD